MNTPPRARSSVIRLMVNLLIIEDSDDLTKPGVVSTMYEPTARTGGVLSASRRIPAFAG